MKQSNMKAQIFVLMGAILWGTTGSAQAFAPSDASPIVIGALRMAIGGTALFVMALIQGAFKTKMKMDKKYILLASVCMAAYQPLFFMGVSKTGVALGTVVAIGSSPVFSGLVEYIRGQKPNIKWMVATAFSIIGCILLFSGRENIAMDIWGLVFSLGAGLSYAIYVTVSRKLIQEGSRVAVNGAVFFLSALILSPILFVNDLGWLVSVRGSLVALHLGLLATALAYTLFVKGLFYLPASKAVTLTLAEPLTAFLLGVLLIKEDITLISAIGAFVLFGGLLINALPEKIENN